ncbi:unnamed protein product, partial [Ixodes hexagonus]
PSGPTGLSAECPPQRKKPNLTVCNKGSQVCIGGNCEGSVCLLFGYEDCQPSGPSYGAAKLCKVFCKASPSATVCIDPCKEQKLLTLCGKARPRGSACNGNMGYCDVHRRCRAADEEGALRRLQSIFFGTGKISRWIQNNLWATIPAVFLLTAGVVVFIRCCAVFTPSSNPRLPEARKVHD